MLLTYLNLTPDERVDITSPGADAELKAIKDSVNRAIKKKTGFLFEKERRKSTSANYDEISLLDIFGALDY